MTKQRGYDKLGFTFIEIIVSSLIMAITLGGVFTIFASANRFVFRAERRLRAVNLIQQEIERRRVQVRFDTWLNPNDTVNLGVNGPGWTAWSGTLGLMPTFRYRVDTDDHSAFPSAVPAVEACRKVYMQARWNEP